LFVFSFLFIIWETLPVNYSLFLHLSGATNLFSLFFEIRWLILLIWNNLPEIIPARRPICKLAAEAG
jgi:hypothetical protein